MAASRIAIRDACGVYALRGVIGWAEHHDLRAELLAATPAISPVRCTTGVSEDEPAD